MSIEARPLVLGLVTSAAAAIYGCAQPSPEFPKDAVRSLEAFVVDTCVTHIVNGEAEIIPGGTFTRIWKRVGDAVPGLLPGQVAVLDGTFNDIRPKNGRYDTGEIAGNNPTPIALNPEAIGISGLSTSGNYAASGPCPVGMVPVPLSAADRR